MKETQTLSAHQYPKPGPAGSLPQPSPRGTAAQHPNPWPKHPARLSPFSLLAARANSRSPDPALGPAPAGSSARPTPAPRDAPLSPSARARSLPPGPRRQRPHELTPLTSRPHWQFHPLRVALAQTASPQRPPEISAIFPADPHAEDPRALAFLNAPARTPWNPKPRHHIQPQP